MSNIQFVARRKTWYSIALITLAASIILLAVYGLRLGIDFTGGTLYEISFSKSSIPTEEIEAVLRDHAISNGRIQATEDQGFIIRTPEITEEQHQLIKKDLESHAIAANAENTLIEKRFESFGSSLGAELKIKSWYAIIGVLVFIIIYLAYAFRQVSYPVASWKFGAVAVIALAHDTLFVLGFFALLGAIAGIEIDSFFITALLTLLGFSVHDTIVTLDRVRENLFRDKNAPFDTLVNMSINQTVARSINTSVTTLLAVISIYFFGGKAIQPFSIALIFGIITGTYSSIFIAAPLLVTWHNFSRKRAVK